MKKNGGTDKGKPLFGRDDFNTEQIQTQILYAMPHNVPMEIFMRTCIVDGLGYLWFLIGPAAKKRNNENSANNPMAVFHMGMLALIC